MPLSPDELQAGLVAHGYDPSKYEAQETPQGTVQIFPRITASPTTSVPSSGSSYAGTDNTVSLPRSIVTGITHSALPAAVGGATMAGAGALAEGLGLASGVGTIPTLLATLGLGLYAGNKAAKAQTPLISNVLGDQAAQQFTQQEQQAQVQHPIGNAIGGAAANVFGGMMPSLSNLSTAGRTLVNLPQNLRTLKSLQGLNTPEMQNLVNVGLGAGLPVASTLGQGQPINGQTAVEALLGSLFNRPMGHAPLAESPSNARIADTQQQISQVPELLQQLKDEIAKRSTAIPASEVAANMQQRIEALPSTAKAPGVRGVEALQARRDAMSRYAALSEEPDIATLEGEGGTAASVQAEAARARQEAQQEAEQNVKMRQILDSVPKPVEPLGDLPSPYHPYKPLTENQLRITEPSIQQSLANRSLPPAPEGRTQLQEGEQADIGKAPEPTSVDDTSTPKWWDFIRKLGDTLGEHHNVGMSYGGQPTTESGVPLNGSSVPRNMFGRAMVNLTAPKLQTLFHEFGHTMYDDIRPSVQAKLESTVQQLPEYKDWITQETARVNARDGSNIDPADVASGKVNIHGTNNNTSAPKEFIAQSVGEHGDEMAQQGGLEQRFMDELKDSIKVAWGKPTRDQLNRVMFKMITKGGAYGERVGATDIRTGAAIPQQQDKEQSAIPIGDKEAYGELQRQLAELKYGETPDFDNKFHDIVGQMETIKNRNSGYAPGTEPDIRHQEQEQVPIGRTPEEDQAHERAYNEVVDDLYRKMGETGVEHQRALDQYQKERSPYIAKDMAIQDYDLSNLQLNEAEQKALKAEDQFHQMAQKHPTELAQNQEKEQTDISLKGARSGIEAIRTKNTPNHTYMADTLTRMLNGKQELMGKLYNAPIAAVNKLDSKGQTNVDKALQQSRLTGKDTMMSLRTPQERAAYRAVQETNQYAGKYRKDKNIPVVTASGKREAGQDPHYYQNIIDPTISRAIRTGEGDLSKYKTDYININKERLGGEQQAKDAWNNLASVLRGDLSKSAPNSLVSTRYNAIRRAESTVLPESMRQKDLVRNVATYGRRAAEDLAWATHVESDPRAARLLGMEKDLWDKPLPQDVMDKYEPIIGDPAVKSAVSTLGNERYSPISGEETAHAVENMASSLMLATKTEAHKAITNMATPLIYANKPTVVKDAVKAATNISTGWAHALAEGTATLPRGNAAYNLKMLTGASSLMPQRIRALGELMRTTYTLGHLPEKWSIGFMQMMNEQTIPHKIADAQRGDTVATSLMKQIDPDYSATKKYTKADITTLAARLSGIMHGTKDIRTLPPWMLKDSEFSAFFKLAGWQMTQTNNAMKHIITPARNGNYVPLLTSLLGTTLAGSVINNLRHKMGDKEGSIPTLDELVSVDALKKQGYGGKSLEENDGIIAYNIANWASMGGFAGLISQTIKNGFDINYKNTPQGSVFPLDEIISSTGTIGQHIAAAISQGDSNVIDILTRGLSDWAKANVQALNIGIAQASKAGLMPENAIRADYSKKLQQLRRYKMAEGVPYDDQSSIGAGEENPYLNVSASQFKRNPDISSAIEQSIPLVQHIFDKYSENPQVIPTKLAGLRTMNYETMPNQDEQPIEFYRYLAHMANVKGGQAATDLWQDYMMQHMSNQLKASMIPSFGGARL